MKGSLGNCIYALKMTPVSISIYLYLIVLCFSLLPTVHSFTFGREISNLRVELNNFRSANHVQHVNLEHRDIVCTTTYMFISTSDLLLIYWYLHVNYFTVQKIICNYLNVLSGYVRVTPNGHSGL